MACEVYCDYCGEAIEERCAEVNGEGRRGYGRDAGFEYHREECYPHAVRALEDLAKWAHRGEGSGLTWQLVDAPARGNGRATTELGEPHIPVGEEYERRVKAGTPIHEWVRPQAVRALRHNNLITLEEVAQLMRWQVAAIEGIGSKAMRMLDSAFICSQLTFREDDRETAGASDRTST